MGSCPEIKFSSSHSSLPVLNMVDIGFPNSSKSSIIKNVGVYTDESEVQDNSLVKVQLEIGSFILQKLLKIIVFQLPSSGSKTWKYYCIKAHILAFVIDSQRLMRQGLAHKQQIKAILKEIDGITPQQVIGLCNHFIKYWHYASFHTHYEDRYILVLKPKDTFIKKLTKKLTTIKEGAGELKNKLFSQNKKQGNERDISRIKIYCHEIFLPQFG